MPLHDLSLVTRAVSRLIEEHVAAAEAWQPRARPTVSPRPPDEPNGAAITLYLYHAEEDPQYRNPPPSGMDHPPVRTQPLALTLHYQLATHPTADDDAAYYTAQLLLGCAMRALHDVTLLTSSTEIAGVRILDAVGLGDIPDRLRITFRAIPAEDAVSYWTAGSTPTRLATYYQVGAVLLEGAVPQRSAPPVLQVGIHTFVQGEPRLLGSENRYALQPPGFAEPRELALRPAEVPVGDGVQFAGVDLGGDDVALLLRCARWESPLPADAGWGVTVLRDHLFATVQEEADGEPVLPGLYTAQARVVRRRRMPDGALRDFVFLSNQTPFSIVPRIDALGAPNAAGVFTVAGYAFAHDDLPPERVEVFLGSDRAQRRTTAGALQPGEFRVVDAATLSIRLPDSLAGGQFLPVRIVVDGAEAPMRWVAMP